jgi:hypothetical protein
VTFYEIINGFFLSSPPGVCALLITQRERFYQDKNAPREKNLKKIIDLRIRAY